MVPCLGDVPDTIPAQTTPIVIGSDVLALVQLCRLRSCVCAFRVNRHPLERTLRFARLLLSNHLSTMSNNKQGLLHGCNTTEIRRHRCWANPVRLLRLQPCTRWQDMVVRR